MQGILDSSGQHDIVIRGFCSLTASLTSTAGNRAVEISTNNGVTYAVPQYDIDEPDCIAVVISAAITNIRFQGAEGDEWSTLP